MLISQNIIDALNGQVGMEFAASLQYDAIASHFAAEALPGLASHFYKQSSEERVHAHKFMKFILDAGGRVVIPKIDAPKAKFQFAKDAVKLALDSEMAVTKAIDELASMAQQEKDYLTSTFLQWFITEQMEEVSSMDQLLRMVERAGEAAGLLQVEQYIMQGKIGMPLGSPEKDAE